MVAETNVPRIERMLAMMKSAGFSEKLIFIGSKGKFRSEFFKRCPDITCITVEHAWQVEAVVRKFTHVKLIHCFESRSLFPWHAMTAAGKNIPVIFDFQDLYTNYTGDNALPAWLRENLWFEKECLKNATALISYSLEWIPARKSLGLPRKKVLYFPFFLDDAEIRTARPTKNVGEIHLVYAGGIAAADRNISFNMTLTEQKIRGSNVFLHVYPSPTSVDEVIESYFQYAARHPNLIMHHPVNNNELSGVLNQYDFGIIPFFKTLEYQSSNKYRYSSALKIFNYMEAGLPVIIASDVEYQAWLIRHYAAGIAIDSSNLSDLPLILQKQKKSDFFTGIQKVQDSLKLSKHIHKIQQLYKELTEEL